MALLFIAVRAGQEPAEDEVSYRDFLAKVQSHQVTAVTLNGRDLHGYFANSQTGFHVLLPPGKTLDPAWMNQPFPVRIEDKPNRSWLASLLQASPFLVLAMFSIGVPIALAAVVVALVGKRGAAHADSEEGMMPREILRQWMAAINGHDVAALAALMAADFRFVDGLGNTVSGGKQMEAGWQGYFAMCPDYWIREDLVLSDGDTLLLTGEAGGTIDGQAWRIPAAWKAVVRDGLLAEWRVFADNKPVYDILAKRVKK
jgi:ketosteroid isomerase-like protein